MKFVVKKRVVILGAGLAGISCACRLTELGNYEITVIEKEASAGGLAISIHYKGHTSDLGPHRIHTEIGRVREFLEKWAGDELVTCRRKSRMLLDGRFIPYPPGALSTLIHFGPFRVAHFLGSYIWSHACHKLGLREEQTYEGVMERAFGRALYRAIIKPYTEKTWGMKAAELSADVAKARVSAGGFGALAKRLVIREKTGSETSLKKFLYTRGRIENLPLRLKKSLEEHGVKFLFNSEVTGLEDCKRKICRVHFQKDGIEKTLDADFCFSTIPLPDLIYFLQKSVPDARIRKIASSLEYLAMILVFVRVRKPHISKDTWLYFPQPDVCFNRGYEAKNFDGQIGPPDESLLCLELTCRKDDARWNTPDDSLKEKVCADLVKTHIVQPEDIIDAHLVRLSYAYPVYDLIYRMKLRKLWSYLERFPLLITLGRQGLFHHNNMDHSIYEGLLAADYFHTKKKPCAAWYRDADQFRKLRIVD